MSIDGAAPVTSHTAIEDVQGILSALLLVTLALAIFQHLGLVTGGVAGLALLSHYVFGWPFGVMLFLFNLPFYIFAWLLLGWRFTLKSLAAVGMLSMLLEFVPDWISFNAVHPIYGAIIGGLMVGVGFVALFRHRSSLGGFGIMALWLQDRFQWRAGWVQLGLDLIVLGLAYLTTPLPILLYSILGGVVMNVILALNHREGRYLAR
jgi:uncharacterized membrane-anchored protein YitT (DUF2179 family)